MMPPSTRILAYDRARALALIGMIFVNSTKIMNINNLKPWWADALITFITGRAAVVFVMLAGVGMAIAYDRIRDDAKPLLKMRLVLRAALLGIIGLLLTTVWNADILHFYTAYIIAGTCLLGQRSARLNKILGGLIVLCMPVCAMLAYEDQGGQIFGDSFDQGALGLLAHYLFLSKYYPVLPWFCFFMLGMLFGRWERSPNRRKLATVLAGSTVLLIAVELLSALMNAETVAGRWFDIETPEWRAFSLSEAFPVGPLFVLSAAASGLALIALLRLLPEGTPTPAAGTPLTAFGRMSLTIYIAHILIGHACKPLFATPQGLAASHQMIAFASIFILSGILFADRWMRHFKRGPLEMMLHELTGAFLRRRRPTLPADA